MNIRHIASVSGLLLSITTAAAAADQGGQGATTTIDIAGHAVPVVAGGLYDRYRSNPPLDVIQAGDPGLDLSWFKQIKKEKVDIGFESYSPNFYYKNSRVTAIYTADLAQLKALMPPKVLAQVQPLQIWPGRGLVVLTAYAYEYCDNDSYNEVGLSVVTNRPGHSNLGPFSLVGQSMSKDFWGYVLKLPVNTELAKVRGVVGYNLPKWLAPIDLKNREKTVVFEIKDSATGQVDVTLETARLDELSDKPELVTNSFTNIDQHGQLTYGYAVSRQLKHATSTNTDAVKLTLGDGSLATYIKALKLGKMLRYEYVPDFQSALYVPKPLGTLVKLD